MTKIIANDGDKAVRLVAEFRAWPQIVVKWYKENRELQNGSKYGSVYENSVAELIIKDIVKHDAGSYTVVASSPFGEALLSADLIVEDASAVPKNGNTHLLPSILVQPLSDQMIRVGKKARFTVAASFPPEPQVNWYKGKERFGDSDRFQISKQGGVCSLDIMMVEPSDDGIWKCEIITSFGYAVSLANLHAIVPKGYRKPEFLEGLKALLTEQGTVSLECKVVGVPTPLLRWFKDGKEIKAGDMFNLRMQGNDESSLGTYTCVAINCMGKAVSSAQVTVMEKTEDKLKPKVKVEDPVPLFLENLDDKTIKVGESLRFTVRVRTPPSVQVHWYNEEEEVEAGEKYHLSQVDDGIFHLDVIPVEITDKGEWRCVAYNQYGKTASTCNLTLTVPKNYRSPEFVEDLQAIFTDDGLVSFECKVVGVPTPILRWYKDGLELKPGDVHQLSGTNSLGSYSCVAKNCMGLASSLAELTLEDIYGAKERRKPPAKHPPRFTQHLKDEIAVIGDPFRFTISVTCPPVPEITWYKDNIRVEEVVRYHLRRERNGIYHLDVDMLEIADQGSWKCLAVNDYGHSLTQCGLKVIVPKQYKKPKFIENLRAVLSEEGTVSLECKVVGVPQPTLKWYKDGIELKAGDIYKIVSGEGGTSSLGTYTCEARNCMGLASSTAALLAFDDKYLSDRLRADAYQHELSTIEERSEFSTYGTPSLMDNWDESKADMEFSIYETPDITEDEARQIIEMFADEVSEYVSTKEAPELPPLRFIKESAMVGNILMEAIIIDVPIECCSRVEDLSQKTPIENLATEADIADMSIMDPVVVDLPYDYSEAASLHELRIDFSEEGEVVIKDASMKEAVIVEAQVPLTAQETSIDGISMEKLTAKAVPIEKSILQPLVVTAPEQLQAAEDNAMDKADSEHVAIEVQMRDGMESAIIAADVPPVLFDEQDPIEANMLEASSDQFQQLLQADDTNVQRPTTVDQGEAISEDITPSENLGTEADVESIASLEEFASDYVNGFNDEAVDEEYFPGLVPVLNTGEGLEFDAEIQQIQEAERATPNWESALEGHPLETDLAAATPTPTPDIQRVLELENGGGAPSVTPQPEDSGWPVATSSKVNEPGLLAELASTVLQRAAEGIMTTAVIAESLVAAAASMILPPEERQGTSKDSFEEQAFALEANTAEQELAQIEQQSLMDQESASKISAAEMESAQEFIEEAVRGIGELQTVIAHSSEIGMESENVVGEFVHEIPAQADVIEVSPVLPVEVYSPEEASPSEVTSLEDVAVEKASVQLKEAEALIHQEPDRVENLESLPEKDFQHDSAVMLQEPVDAIVTEVQSGNAEEESLQIAQDVPSVEALSSESVTQRHLVVRSVSLQESITAEESLDDIAAADLKLATATLLDSSLQNICVEAPAAVMIDLGLKDEKLSHIVEEDESEAQKTESLSEIPIEEQTKEGIEEKAKEGIDAQSMEGIVEEHAKEGIVEEHAKNGIVEEHAKEGIVEEHAKEGIVEEHAKEGIVEEQAKEGIAEEQAKEGIAEEQAKEGIAEEQAKECIAEEQAKECIAEEQAKEGIAEEQAKEGIAEEQAKEGIAEEQAKEGIAEEQAKEGIIEERANEDPLQQHDVSTSSIGTIDDSSEKQKTNEDGPVSQTPETADLSEQQPLTAIQKSPSESLVDDQSKETSMQVQDISESSASVQKEASETTNTLVEEQDSQKPKNGQALPHEEIEIVDQAPKLEEASGQEISSDAPEIVGQVDSQGSADLGDYMRQSNDCSIPDGCAIKESDDIEPKSKLDDVKANNETGTPNLNEATELVDSAKEEFATEGITKQTLAHSEEGLTELVQPESALLVGASAVVQIQEEMPTEIKDECFLQTAEELIQPSDLSSCAVISTEPSEGELQFSDVPSSNLSQNAEIKTQPLDLCIASVTTDGQEPAVETQLDEIAKADFGQVAEQSIEASTALISDEQMTVEPQFADARQTELSDTAETLEEPPNLNLAATVENAQLVEDVSHMEAPAISSSGTAKELTEVDNLVSVAASVIEEMPIGETVEVELEAGVESLQTSLQSTLCESTHTDVEEKLTLESLAHDGTEIIPDKKAVEVIESSNLTQVAAETLMATTMEVLQSDPPEAVQVQKVEESLENSHLSQTATVDQAAEILDVPTAEAVQETTFSIVNKGEPMPQTDDVDTSFEVKLSKEIEQAGVQEAEACVKILEDPSKDQTADGRNDQSVNIEATIPVQDETVATAEACVSDSLMQSFEELQGRAEIQADSKEPLSAADTEQLNAANRVADQIMESCFAKSVVQGASEFSQVESLDSKDEPSSADGSRLNAAEKTAENLIESCMATALVQEHSEDSNCAEEILPKEDTAAQKAADMLIESCMSAALETAQQAILESESGCIEKEHDVALLNAATRTAEKLLDSCVSEAVVQGSSESNKLQCHTDSKCGEEMLPLEQDAVYINAANQTADKLSASCIAEAVVQGAAETSHVVTPMETSEDAFQDACSEALSNAADRLAEELVASCILDAFDSLAEVIALLRKELLDLPETSEECTLGKAVPEAAKLEAKKKPKKKKRTPKSSPSIDETAVECPVVASEVTLEEVATESASVLHDIPKDESQPDVKEVPESLSSVVVQDNALVVQECHGANTLESTETDKTEKKKTTKKKKKTSKSRSLSEETPVVVASPEETPVVVASPEETLIVVASSEETQVVVASPEETPVVVASPEETPVVVVASHEETPVVVASPEETPVVVASPEETPVVVASPEETPVVVVASPEETPVVVASPEETPVVVASPEETPVVVVASPEETPVVVASPEETPVAVASPEETPVVVESPEETPVVVSSPEETPVVVASPEETPVVVASPEETPVVVASPEDTPVVVANPEETPVVVASPEETPVVVASPEETPVVVASPEETPVVVASPEETPVVVASPEDTPVVVASPEEAPFIVAIPEETPVVVASPAETPVVVPTTEETPVEQCPLVASEGKLDEVVTEMVTALDSIPKEESTPDIKEASECLNSAAIQDNSSVIQESRDLIEADKTEKKKTTKKKKKTSKSSPVSDETPIVVPSSDESSSRHPEDQPITCPNSASINEQCPLVASEGHLDEPLKESVLPLDDFSKEECRPNIEDTPERFSSVVVLDQSAIVLETKSQDVVTPQGEENKIIQSPETSTMEKCEASSVVPPHSEQSTEQKVDESLPADENKEQEEKSETKKPSKKKKTSMKKKTSSEVDEIESSKEIPNDTVTSIPEVDRATDVDPENKENIPESHDVTEHAVLQPLSEGILTDKFQDDNRNVDNDMAQEIPKSEGGKEISRLKRSNSRKDKLRRSSRKSEDGDSLSRRSSRTDSRDSSTGDLTDEGDDFASMSPELSRQKRIARTVSGGDLAQIHETEELSKVPGQRRRSCPTVDSLPEIKEQLEQLSNIADDDGVNVDNESVANGAPAESPLTKCEDLKEPPDKSTEVSAHNAAKETEIGKDTCENGIMANLPNTDQNELKKEEGKPAGKKSTKGKTKKGTRKSSKDDPEDVKCVNGALDSESAGIAANGSVVDVAAINGSQCADKTSSDKDIENKVISTMETSDNKNIDGNIRESEANVLPKSDSILDQGRNGNDTDRDEGIDKDNKDLDSNGERKLGRHEKEHGKEGDKSTMTELEKSEDKSSGYSTEEGKSIVVEDTVNIEATPEIVPEKKSTKVKKTKKSKNEPSKDKIEQKIEELPKTDVAASKDIVEEVATKPKTTKAKDSTVAEDMARMKHELLALDLEMKPSKLFIEELNSSFEDSSTDKTPMNMVIESVSDDNDDTLVNLDDELTIREIDDSLMGVEEIPLDDLSMEDVIENMRTLRRLQTITEVDEITDDDDGGQHIVIATLRPCWEEDISRRAHSLQPAKEQITHTIETIRRCSSGDMPDKKMSVKTKDTPVFIMKLQDLTVPVGYRMRLTCCVIGTPEPKIQWLKNGSPITIGMGYREITDFGICILEIPRASLSDSGEYSCIAKNDHGEDRTQGILTVRGKTKPGLVEPAFTRSILDMKGHCGDSITMDCTVIGWPTPNVAWVKDGHSLELDDRMETSVTSGGTHRLVIQDARCEDSGVYKCMAQNALGKDEITAAVKIMDKGGQRSSRFVRDTLTKRNRTSSEHGTLPTPFLGEIPKVQTQLGDRTAHLGSTVTFQCEITGKPKPELVWLHNGRPLTPSRHVKLSQQGDTYTLTLLDTSYSDLGMYTCKASNKGGTSYTSGCLHFGLQDEDLEFGLAPVFITKPSSVNVGKHDEIVLACKVEGRPRPKVTWLKGARDMSLSRRAYKDSKGDIHKLVIHRAMNVDDGEYIVEARNKLGKEVVRCSVSVNNQSGSGDEDEAWDYHRTTSALNVLRGYRPYVPQKELPGRIGGEPKVTDTGRNWVTLVWPRPVDDGGSSIMAYRIEACELPGHAWEEVGLSPITMCDVYNLKPESKYLFRVSARNMFGWGQPVSMSEALAIARRPDMPHFTSVPPSYVQTALGADVVLECLVSGKPDPVITWFKDRERIRAMANSRFQMRFDGVSATITLRDVQADDEGCYMCEATSDGGRVTTFAVVAVGDEPASSPPRSESRRLSPEEPSELPPVFSMRLRDRTVQVNNLVRLTCQVQGAPPPIVTWYKDGRKVRTTEYQIFQEDNFQTLEIPKACEEDSGEYAVVASNNHGEIACKCRVVVDRDCGRLSHPPTFSKQLMDCVVTKGDTASLHCKVVHLGGRATWFQNGQKLPHCRKYRMRTMPDGTCILSILQVTSSDTGTYTCVASNQSGRTASTCTLKVESYSSTDDEYRRIEHELQTHVGYSKPPVFLTKPRSTEVVEYDNVELICEVIGDPKPEVLWLRDGLTFKYQKDPEHFIRLGDGPFYRLDIPSVTIDDTGTYAVIARNCHGDTKAIISLQVFARGQGIEEAMSYKSQTKAGRIATRPEVTQTLKNLQCSYGDSVAFECRINATPLPEIRWEKDGHVLHSSEDFQLFQDGPICRLKIVEVFPEDHGEYVCVAYNDAGKVSTSASLTVQKSEEKENEFAYNQTDALDVIHQRPLRKRAVVDTPTKSKKKMVGPKFITNPHSRIVDEGDTVKFTCSIAGHPEPLVQWDKLGRLIKPDGRFDVVDREDLHTLIIRDVVPADAGMYTVTASNSIGRVYASAKLDVIAKRKGKIAVPSSNPASSGLSHPPPCMSPTKSSRVITITAYEVPTVHQPLSDRNIQQKDRLYMSCEILGNPTPTITWLWNETIIKNSKNTRCKFNGRLATLEIDRVQEFPQEALITCKASNSQGTTQTTAKLTIKECQSSSKKATGSSAITRSFAQKAAIKTGTLKIARPPTNTPRKSAKELKDSSTNRKAKSLLSKLNCGAKCVASNSPLAPTPHHAQRYPSPIEEFRHDTLGLAEDSPEAVPTVLSPPCPSENGDNVSHLTLSSLHLADLCTDTQPTFLQELEDVVVRDGQNVTLLVQLTGRAPFEVIWVHNDQEITNCDDTRYISYEDNKYALVIADIFPEDSGIYTCEAYNEFGHAESSCKVLVKEPAVLPQPSTAQPSFEFGLSERTECVDGDHLLLVVQVSGAPSPLINWFKDGQKLKSRIRITTRQEGNRHLCYFSRLRPRDAGIYSAVATNNLGKVTTSTALSIRSHLPPSRQMSSSSDAESITSPHCNGGAFEKQQNGSLEPAPSDEQDPLSEKIACGDHESASVTAEDNSKTCPTIKSSVLTSEVEVHSSDQVEGKLQLIRNVHVEDLPLDIPVVTALIVKESPAQIIRGPLNTTVLEGQKAVLKVHFIGKPQCAVKWIKGGKMVECSERIRMETCEEMSCLTLDNVHSDDSGKYIVVVENAHGADCHFASLAVEGPPNPPASKPVVSQITSSSVTLCWYGSSFDGGSVLTGYIIEMAKADQPTHWQVLKSNCHSTSYIVNGLELGTEYIFRIRAQNVHGVSGPSTLSDSVLISGKDHSDDDDIYDNHSSETPKKPIEIADSQFSELYDVQECLGNGRFGRVHRVIQRKTQEEYAAKFIRCRNQAARDNVRQEVEIMSCLRHHKLMRLVSAFEISRDMVIVMEYISGGALFERVTADDFDATEKDCILFTRQICEGVRYMHEKFVIHLDLKPENIMCLHRDTHQIKLIDFGLAKRYDPRKPTQILCGTPEFVAPEVINFDPISPATDMWSVGVVCYTLLAGESPFVGANEDETYSNVTRSVFDFEDESFDEISEDAKNFISALIVKKKEKRLTAQECLKHNWLAQQERTMSSAKLCKDKLKKFVIRRKWQKTGNAILALGRMTTMSGLSPRRSPFKTCNSFGGSFSDYGSGGSDCDTLSSVSSHALVPGTATRPEVDQESFSMSMADSRSESTREAYGPVNGN